MKITSKGQYAISAMLYLAVHEKLGPVSLMTIAKKLGISISYAEQLFGILRESGLVKGLRGPGGGYTICKPLSDISLGQIIGAVDIDTVTFPDDSGLIAEEEQAPMMNTITKHSLCTELWGEVSSCIKDFLYNIDLESFLSRQTVQDLIQSENEKTKTASDWMIA